MKTSDKVDVILPKLAKALKELSGVKKASDNPFFKSRYADLNAHLDVAEKALEAQGLILLQPVTSDETGNVVESLVIEPASGQYVSSSMRLILTKQTMQDAGSAVTYARRYTLGSLLSMQALDDDGNVATFGKTTQASTTTTSTTPARSSFRSGKAKTVTNVPENVDLSNVNPGNQVSEEWS